MPPRQPAPTTISIVPKLRVSRKAMAPGAISMAMARMMPTAFSAPDNRQREQGEEARSAASRTGRPIGLGLLRIEGMQQQIPPLDGNDGQQRPRR